MRFMTWNVWGRFGDRWQRRQRAIAETLRAHRPEFVALQESWRMDGRTQAGELGAELGMTPLFAPSRMPADPHPGVRLGLAILSRFPVRRVEQHPLSDDTIALRAEIRLGSRSMHFVTSCLDWEEDHEQERLEQADALAELVTELHAGGDRVVVAGDLNAPPDHPEIGRLMDVLDDCWRPSTADDGITYSSHNRYVDHDEWLEDSRIDYILATGEPLDRRSTLVGFDEDRGNPPSDHYAVLTDVPIL